jgi:Spy/CpxP family protein refolding chaperone
VLLALFALTLAAPASAQRRGSSNTPVERAELERRLRENFERLVRERLELTEAQATQLADVVLEFQGERLAQQRRESDLRRRLQGQGGSGGRRGGAPLSEEEARAVLAEMRALQNQETEIFNREHERLLGILTPTQLVRYYLIREQLAESLRRVRGPGDRGG